MFCHVIASVVYMFLSAANVNSVVCLPTFKPVFVTIIEVSSYQCMSQNNAHLFAFYFSLMTLSFFTEKLSCRAVHIYYLWCLPKETVQQKDKEFSVDTKADSPSDTPTPHHHHQLTPSSRSIATTTLTFIHCYFNSRSSSS